MTKPRQFLVLLSGARAAAARHAACVRQVGRVRVVGWALVSGASAWLVGCRGSPGSSGLSLTGGSSSGGATASGEGGGATGDDSDSGGRGLGSLDGGSFQSSPDATVAANGECELGSAGSFATSQDLNLFGQIVYYEDGGALPSGQYRVKYVDGCMKYDYFFNWQVQATAPDSGNGGGFWLVGDTSDDRIVMPPGLTESYSAFDDCVTANVAAPAEEFQFDGGKLGVWLNDNPYTDNVAGDDGRNPKWQLTLLGTCPPEYAPK